MSTQIVGEIAVNCPKCHTDAMVLTAAESELLDVECGTCEAKGIELSLDGQINLLSQSVVLLLEKIEDLASALCVFMEEKNG